MSNIVTLNKGEGTVTMSYAAYKAVHHDSVMLGVLLHSVNDPNDRYGLLEEYRNMVGLGAGYEMCQSPLCDEDALKYVYGGF